jgi:hypothetical protein
MSDTSLPFAQHVPGLDDPSLLHGFLPGTRADVPRATRVALGALSFALLLLGALFALYTILSTYQMAHLAREFGAALLYFLVPLYTLASALLLVATGAALIVPRPAAWRFAMRLTLWTMAVSLVAVLFGLCVALGFGSATDEHHRLIRVLGLVVAGVWGAPFFLALLARLYCSRPSPRAAFGA